MIKLIVTDIDGTLVKRWDSGYQSGIYGCDKEAHGKGIHFVACSGQTVLQ
ncbi:MAG: hypothetical protein ACLUTV_03685 [Dorea longicatena]